MEIHFSRHIPRKIKTAFLQKQTLGQQSIKLVISSPALDDALLIKQRLVGNEIRRRDPRAIRDWHSIVRVATKREKSKNDFSKI